MEPKQQSVNRVVPRSEIERQDARVQDWNREYLASSMLILITLEQFLPCR